jgi:hypothetical protein
MNDQALKPRINKRALSSLFMIFSFFWLIPSGIAVHFSEEALEISFHHIAMSAHTAASVVFLAACVVHLVINWASLKRSLVSKTREYMALNKEAAIALVVVTALVLLIVSHAFFL